MPTKNSKIADAEVYVARDMDSIEHERNLASPAGPDTHCSGSIGGGDEMGRKGRIFSDEKGARKSKDE